MNSELEPLVDRYGANLVTSKGEMSETAVRLFMERVRAAGVPARVLYISDFDPGGRSMPVAVARKIEFALTKEEQPLDITLDPIVLTEDQCRRYRLPRTPIKDGERRAAKFEARFGEGATELDALEALHPGELAKITAQAIERHLDPDHRRAFHDAASEHRAELRRLSRMVHDHYAEEIEDLEREFQTVVDAFDGWRERAEQVFDRVAEHLMAADVPVFTPPPPAPRVVTDAEPLFDSRRDPLEQIDRYRAWQGRAPL